jgi:hypothetical protein
MLRAMAKDPVNKDSGKFSITMRGTVKEVIQPTDADEPGTARIAIEGGEESFQSIHVASILKDHDGHEVVLKPGATVEVVIRADGANVTL